MGVEQEDGRTLVKAGQSPQQAGWCMAGTPYGGGEGQCGTLGRT